MIVPPFTRESAIQKVRAAEDSWNSRDPDRWGAGLYRGFGLAKPDRIFDRPRADPAIPGGQNGPVNSTTG